MGERIDGLIKPDAFLPGAEAVFEHASADGAAKEVIVITRDGDTWEAAIGTEDFGCGDKFFVESEATGISREDAVIGLAGLEVTGESPYCLVGVAEPVRPAENTEVDPAGGPLTKYIAHAKRIFIEANMHIREVG